MRKGLRDKIDKYVWKPGDVQVIKKLKSKKQRRSP